jgi:hypothetical protein
VHHEREAQGIDVEPDRRIDVIDVIDVIDDVADAHACHQIPPIY